MDFVHFLNAYVNFDADFDFAIFKVVSLIVCPTESSYHFYLLPWKPEVAYVYCLHPAFFLIYEL